MTERERLIELLRNAEVEELEAIKMNPFTYSSTDFTAEYLLANGVIVPPCKPGDYIYEICERRKNGEWQKVVVERLVRSISVGIGGTAWAQCGTTITVFLGENSLNKTVFLTREEAERALKEAQG